MPISGLTTQHTPGAGLRRLGKLVKGAERTQEDLQRKRPGRDLKHFRVKFESGFEHLLPAWQQMYGDEPAAISGAFLLTQNVDLAFGAWMEEWAAGGLIHRCTGDEQVRWFDAKRGRCVDEIIPCQRDAAKPCACKQVGRLHFVLPAFWQTTGVPGYFTLETHAVTDIGKIFNALKDIELLFGKVLGVPLTLVRVPHTFEQPELDRQTKQPTGKRIHVEKWLVELRVDEQFARERSTTLMLNDAAPAALPTGNTLPALPGGSDDDDDEPDWMEAWVDQALETRTVMGSSLTGDDLRAALGVRRRQDFAGTQDEAEAMLSAYIASEEAKAAQS